VGDSPSIVVTFLSAARDTCVAQDRIGSPSRWTVHAPHCDKPHPNFVPVRPMVSRITHNSGMSGLTSTSCRFPLTVKEIMDGLL
jgi:hypothetical protein